MAKKSLLKDFIIKGDYDIVFLQEVCFEDFSFMYGYEPLVNLGPAKRGTAVLLRVGTPYMQPLFSECGRLISFLLNNVTYVNVYPVSGSQFKRERNFMFLNEIAVHLNRLNASDILIGGDFNCILNPADTRGETKNICYGLKQVTTSLNMKDAHSSINSNTRIFTFFRGTSASRLDRFYVTKNFFQTIITAGTHPTAFSDHSAVDLKLKINQNQITTICGRGYWKINSALLANNEVLTNFENVYQTVRARESFSRNFIRWWDDMKKKTKSFFRQEIIQFNTEIANNKNMYYNYLNELSMRRNNGEDVHAEFCFTRSKLLEIEQNKLNAMGYILKPSVLSEEEKLSVFHVTNQKKNQKVITNLQDGESLTTNSERIKTIFVEHFEKLFNGENNQTNEHYDSINFLNQTLDNNDALFLTNQITENELKMTLRSCSKKKSPGIDGLTYEFYLKNFEIMKNDLLTLFNRFLENPNEIPANFSDGVIILLPKISPARSVKDYRPISLLNSDYKIFAKILANRLKECIQKIIHDGQTACINGKSCVSNLTKLRNLVANKTKSRRIKFTIMSLDLEKAFDRVKLDFLWKCLEKMQFPEQFIGILKALYKNAKSKIMINGTLTRDFKIKNSVRQRSPLSMARFVIYIEPLIQMINNMTVGISLQQSSIKCMAYADDINFIVTSDSDADRIFEGICNFCNESNAKINLEKSAFLRINNCPIGPQLIAERDCLKILGITLYPDLKKIIEKNYEKILNNINYMINLHKRRNLNIVQKIWFANTFILSKLWYLSQIVPPENLM